MKKTVLIKNCAPRFHATRSNSKLGKMLAISYVPGADFRFLKNGTLVSDCKGTCGCVDCKHCERACYACRSYDQYPAVTLNRVENTMQLREDIQQHFSDIGDYIEKHHVAIVRYTESGEIESYEQFYALYWLAKCTPDTRFYLYTKNYDVLRRFFRYHVLPDNLVVLVSIWGDLGREEWNEFKKYSNVKCFAVHAEDLMPAIMCPAYKLVNGKVVRTGKTCAECKLCFDSKAKMIGCYEH